MSSVLTTKTFSTPWMVRFNRLNEFTLLLTSYFLIIQTDFILPVTFRVDPYTFTWPFVIVVSTVIILNFSCITILVLRVPYYKIRQQIYLCQQRQSQRKLQKRRVQQAARVQEAAAELRELEKEVERELANQATNRRVVFEDEVQAGGKGDRVRELKERRQKLNGQLPLRERAANFKRWKEEERKRQQEQRRKEVEEEAENDIQPIYPAMPKKAITAAEKMGYGRYSRSKKKLQSLPF